MRIGVAVALASALLGITPTASQDFPSRPPWLIIPYTPGGGVDVVAGLLAPPISERIGQQLVIDNKPGASTIIGTRLMAAAQPDGYTIGIITDSHAINAAAGHPLPYGFLARCFPPRCLYPAGQGAHRRQRGGSRDELVAAIRRPHPIRHGKVREHLLGYGYQAAFVKHRRDTKKVRTITENKVERRHGQRLLLDATIRSVGIERDQPRRGCTIYSAGLDA